MSAPLLELAMIFVVSNVSPLSTPYRDKTMVILGDDETLSYASILVDKDADVRVGDRLDARLTFRRPGPEERKP
jgi:hypothetical protein